MIITSFFFVLTMIVILMVLKPFEQTSLSNVFDGYAETDTDADRSNDLTLKETP